MSPASVANLRRALAPAAGCLFAVALLGACNTLPDAPAVAPTMALPAAADGPLAATARAVRATRGGDDALHLIKSARQGLTWRLALIDSARVSIDAQYFTWANDAAGSLILLHLWAAADRGVRVRLLIDDLYLVSQRSVRGTDKPVKLLDMHPNIEVKIFNPGKHRAGSLGLAGNYLGYFEEFNRRMHNKLLIADGHFAIMGGRNLANEYFGWHEPYNFLDLDVLAAGPVTGRIARAYDRYWNSQPAFPASGFKGSFTQQDVAVMRLELATAVKAAMGFTGDFPTRPRQWTTLLRQLPATMHSGKTIFLQDDPAIFESRRYRLYDMIRDLSRAASDDVVIVTPYLIPVEGFIDKLRQAVARGVRVRVLTASLAAGDHSAVHAHYKGYRPDLLDTGAELYEFHHQPNAEVRALADSAPVQGKFVALHPKVAVIDGKTCFVGSLNLDPRALVINTENGLLINSPGFCAELLGVVELLLAPDNAWRVSRDTRGKLQWSSSHGTVTRAPARGTGQRLADFLFRWLPVEGQL